jgi:predicted dehydrogenase
MADKKFKVGVIGTGMIGNAAHLPAWKNQEREGNVEVVGTADIIEARAVESAERYDVPNAYGDWETMLDELDLDIVSVCTPNNYHAPISIAALKAGVNVFCEKPLAPGYDAAVEMYEAAEETGQKLFITQTTRFSPTSWAAKEFVDNGDLGEIYYVETSAMRRRGIPKWGMFHMKEHNTGGPVYDLGVHMVDLLFWLMGNPKVKSVSGKTYLKLGNKDEGLKESLADSGAPLGVFTPRPYDYREFNVEDFASGYVRLENGCTMGFRTSWAANIPEGVGKTFLVGTEGGLQISPFVYVTNQGSYQVDVTPKIPGGRDVQFSGHWEAAEHYVKVLRGEEEMIVKKEETLNVIRTLEALYESSEQDREIVFEEDIL